MTDKSPLSKPLIAYLVINLISKCYLLITSKLIFDRLSFAFLLAAYIFEITPIILIIFAQPKSKIINQISIGLLTILMITNIINFLCFLETKEFISEELIRNINPYGLEGFINEKNIVYASLTGIFTLLVSYHFSAKLIANRLALKDVWKFFAFGLLGTTYFYTEQLLNNPNKLNDVKKAILIGRLASLNQIVYPSYFATFKSLLSANKEPNKLIPKRKETLSREELNWLKENLIAQDHSNTGMAITAPKKIILITAESLPLSYLHSVNKKIPSTVTPFLNTLAKENGLFQHYFTAGIPTDHGITALLCSFPYYGLEFADNFTCLPDFLRSLGFDSYLFRGVSLFYAEHHKGYKKLFKFDQMYGRDEYPEKPNWGWGASDEIVLENALKKITREIDSKQFVVINLMDTHPPYFSKGSKFEKVSQLLGSLNNLDSNLSNFVDKIKADNLWDDSLIIITSDHSPNHGDYYHWTNTRDYLPNKIPIFFLGGSKLTQVLNTLDKSQLYSQLDFAPTLYNLLAPGMKTNHLGTSMISISRKASRKYVASISSKRIYLHSKDNCLPTDTSLDSLDQESGLTNANALRKLILNNYHK